MSQSYTTFIWKDNKFSRLLYKNAQRSYKTLKLKISLPFVQEYDKLNIVSVYACSSKQPPEMSPLCCPKIAMTAYFVISSSIQGTQIYKRY